MGFADEFVADLKRAGAPEEPEPEYLRALASGYRTNPAARDQIILQLALPVVTLARRYKSRNNADDVLSEAILALVECVDRWPTVAVDDDIHRFVEFSVKKRMKDFVDNDQVFVIPSRRAREKDEPVPVPQAEDLESLPPVGPDSSFDLREFFSEREDPRDQVVVEMRIAGRDAASIAEAVGMKERWVYTRLRKLERDFARIGQACSN